MWIYEKKLEFPIDIRKSDAKMAKVIIEQYGGGDGELGAALRYLSQKFAAVTPEAKATLNDIGTEELAHLEMIGTMVHQLTRGLSDKEIKEAGLDPYYVAHGLGVYPCAANGTPFTAAFIQSKGDPVTDLYENLAAEQKARSTYEYLLDMTDDPDVIKPLAFLREREIVHFQRFGEALDNTRDHLAANHYFFMPQDMCRGK
ncbi:MAG: manganese catalase family protein [Lachnospiraceae bacterium]|nr:manganese catalase family protein [Lachnospiraceae bacterium]